MAQLNTHTRASFSTHLLSFLEKVFLTRLVRNLVLVPLGKQKVLGKRLGRTIDFHRFANPAANTTAITDGVSPDGISHTSTRVVATLNQYGDFSTVSDQLQDTAINDTLKDFTELMAYRAALSLDSLARNDLDANGTQGYAGTNSSIANVEANTTTITSGDLRDAMEALKNSDVPTYDDGTYRGVLHPRMTADLLAETAANSFMQLAAPTSNEVAVKGSFGTAYSIKLLESTNIRADATSTNTYGNIFLGKDAFGSVALDKSPGAVQMILHGFGEAGSEDPLNQRSTIGYKFWYTSVILEAARAQIVWAYSA